MHEEDDRVNSPYYVGLYFRCTVCFACTDMAQAPSAWVGTDHGALQNVRTTLNKGLDSVGTAAPTASPHWCGEAALRYVRYIKCTQRDRCTQNRRTPSWCWKNRDTTHLLTHKTGTMDGFPWKLFLLSCLVLVESSAQDFGQTQFICTSVPKDMDLCTATMQNSGPAEDLKTTVMQLRETVLQQKETIMNQKETIRELTSKLSRCESQSIPAAGPGGRRPGSKNTMGDVSRGTTDTLAQLGQTLQTLKQRLENLEVDTLRAALTGSKVNQLSFYIILY